MKTFRQTIFCSLLFVCCKAAFAIEPASDAALTLPPLLKLARERNPEIVTAQKKWEAARARASHAATPEKPRLDIERMYAPKGENIFRSANEKNLVFTQEMPFPTTLYLKRQEALKEAAVAEAEYESTAQDVLTRVKNAYALYVLSESSLVNTQENVAILENLFQAVQSRYASGLAAQSDLLKVTVELSKMENTVLTLRQEKDVAAALLNTLLNRDLESPFGRLSPPSLVAIKKTVASLEEKAALKNPALEAARMDVARSKAGVSVARSNYLPDLMLQYRSRTMVDAPSSNDAIVGFSLPLWFWKQQAQVAQAKAEQEGADAELETRANNTRYDVRMNWIKVTSAERLVSLYETSVLPQAQMSFKAAEAGYAANKVAFLDLLDATRTLLSSRLEHDQHIADFQIALAGLERVVGENLTEELQ